MGALAAVVLSCSPAMRAPAPIESPFHQELEVLGERIYRARESMPEPEPAVDGVTIHFVESVYALLRAREDSVRRHHPERIKFLEEQYSAHVPLAESFFSELLSLPPRPLRVVVGAVSFIDDISSEIASDTMDIGEAIIESSYSQLQLSFGQVAAVYHRGTVYVNPLSPGADDVLHTGAHEVGHDIHSRTTPCYGDTLRCKTASEAGAQFLARYYAVHRDTVPGSWRSSAMLDALTETVELYETDAADGFVGLNHFYYISAVLPVAVLADALGPAEGLRRFWGNPIGPNDVTGPDWVSRYVARVAPDVVLGRYVKNEGEEKRKEKEGGSYLDL